MTEGTDIPCWKFRKLKLLDSISAGLKSLRKLMQSCKVIGRLFLVCNILFATALRGVIEHYVEGWLGKGLRRDSIIARIFVALIRDGKFDS